MTAEAGGSCDGDARHFRRARGRRLVSLPPGLACVTIAGNWLLRMAPAPFRPRL